MTIPSTTTDLGAYTLELDRAHVFHSWSAQGALKPFVIAGALGCEVWDFDGNRYLDFSSQLVNMNIGHAHPKVVAAIQEQAAILPTVAPAHRQPGARRGGEAHRRRRRARPFTQGVLHQRRGGCQRERHAHGPPASPAATRSSSQYRSYHGNTGAAIVATGDWRRVPNEFARGHVHFFGPFAYRSEFWSTTPEQESERALHSLRAHHPGRGARTRSPRSCWRASRAPPACSCRRPATSPGVRALADKYGILLIVDEVMSGFGRTGDWFAWQNATINPERVVPDLITFAKGVNSGYVPAGGVIISESIAHEFDDQVFPGGLTYSGHPLAMASIVASIDAMDDEGIVANAAKIGREVLGPGLIELASRHPMIGEVRGLGVFWALDLVTDAATREPVAPATVGLLKTELLDARTAALHRRTTASTSSRPARSPPTRSQRRSRSTTRRSRRWSLANEC